MQSQKSLGKLNKYSRTLSTLVKLNVKLATNVPKPQIARWLSTEFEALGPTYIKIGQFISSRKDIFGDEFSNELSSLRDKVAQINEQDLRTILDQNLDMSKFKHIDKVPIASASIGQVHRATLKNGKHVIVKVKRPNVDAIIKEDVQFLLSTLSLMSFFNMENIQSSIDLLTDFEKNIMNEVDFKHEVENMKKFHKLYHDDRNIIVPYVYKSLSNDNVIVMDYIDSNSILDYQGDKKKLSLRLMDFFVSQLVEYGAIHGDPHAGNMGITADGAIVLFDFGSVIYISNKDRLRMKELVYQLLVNNKKGVVATLKNLGIKIKDESALTSYIDSYINYMRTIDISILQSSHNPSSKLPLQLTDDLFRLIRVYGILEGTCKDLNPKFNYFDVLQNYITDILLDEDFIMYKIATDTTQVVTEFLESSPPSSSNISKDTKAPDVNKRIVDNMSVVFDDSIIKALGFSNIALVILNLLIIMAK